MIRILLYFWSIIILVSCKDKTAVNSDYALSTIDTVKITEQEFKEQCFLRELSDYPQIRGDKKWTNVNHQIKKAVEDFILESKFRTQCDKDKDSPAFLGWAATTFEVLNNDNNCLSVALYLTNGFGGGNMWTPTTKVFNIDPSTGKLMDKDHLIKSRPAREVINKIVFEYFNAQFPNMVNETIGNNFIKDDIEFERIEYGVKNDSLVILIPAYPVGHVSYDIYTIPIK